MPDFYSQNGEDALLAMIFASCDAASSVCIEVGAFNGVDLSNTLYFEELGWRCILVEPNPALCGVIRQRRSAILYECAASDRPGIKVLQVIPGAEEYSSVDPRARPRERLPCGTDWHELVVTARTLDDILEDSGISTLGFASIDVEGHELEVLQGFTLARWRPRVVLIEDSGDLLDRCMLDFMQSRGYRRFYRSGANDWYAAPGEARLRNLPSLLRTGGFHFKGLAKSWLPFGLTRAAVRVKRQVNATLHKRH
jgi:FkbM family methyltransferase